MSYIYAGLLGILIGLFCSLISIRQLWRTGAWPSDKSAASAIFGFQGALLAQFAMSLKLPLFTFHPFYPILIGSSFFATIGILMCRKSTAKSSSWVKSSLGISAVVASYMFLVAFATGKLFHRGLLAAIIDGLRWVRTPLGSLIAPFVVTVFGGAGFLFRERQRKLYAIVEGIFGSTTAIATVVSAIMIFDDRDQRSNLVFDLTFTAFAFVSGIYVLVRAFDNYEKQLHGEVKLHRATRTKNLSTQVQTPSSQGAAQRHSDGWFADKWQHVVGRKFPD